MPDLLHLRTPYFELPSNICTMGMPIIINKIQHSAIMSSLLEDQFSRPAFIGHNTNLNELKNIYVFQKHYI